MAGVSRRELLVSAGGILLASGAKAEPTPRRGGRILVAGSSASISDTLDPARASNLTDYCRGTMFYNGLTSLDEHLVPQPALAESFTHENATVWIFKLRRGVQFHDGRPLTSADVVYSLMRHKDPAVASKAKSLVDQIEGVKADGPNEVRVTLKAPNVDLPVILATFAFHIVPAGTTDFSKGIGTGPYRCKEFRPGVRSVAVRNPDYWVPGRPYLDEIEFIGIADDSARGNALQSGDVDLVSALDPRTATRLKHSRTHAVLESASGQYTDLVMRRTGGPGANPDFVLAMKYLFDREQLKKNVALGHAVVANDQPIPPGHRFYFDGLPQRPYDLDRAKFHLKKSGVGIGPMPLVASPVATYSVELALGLQQAARRAGLLFDVKRMPADGYWSNHWMKSPLGFGNVNPRPSADALFTQFFKSDAAWNESGWKNERFDQLLVAARAEADEGKRRQMYADMQVLVHEQCGLAIPLFISSLDGYSKKLRGLKPMPLGGIMGYSFAEHVWLDA